MHPLLKMLEGGDRRSIGRSNQAVARALEAPALIDVLFDGMVSDDPLLRMRCADAAKKVSAARARRKPPAGVHSPSYNPSHKPPVSQ